ncbi:MAG: HK97 family phage prohead protease [Geminicoccaceae bacterium]|nr:MAG: HK97 family phage prohead protease [Geminicoccaceae bacterium]
MPESLTFDASGVRFSPALSTKLAPGPTAAGVFTGLASPFGGEPDAYGHVIEPGAFRRSLERHAAAGTMPAMLWSHNPEAPIGRWLKVEEGQAGLQVQGELNLDTQRGREALAHLQHRDLSGLSIGYRVAPGGFRTNQDGTALLTELDLVEISVVAFPANPRARVNLGSKRDLESLLVKSGLAKAAAAKIAAGGFPALGTDDTEARHNAIKAAAERIRRAASILERTG